MGTHTTVATTLATRLGTTMGTHRAMVVATRRMDTRRTMLPQR